jgi:hypothetical protein
LGNSRESIELKTVMKGQYASRTLVREVGYVALSLLPTHLARPSTGPSPFKEECDPDTLTTLYRLAAAPPARKALSMSHTSGLGTCPTLRITTASTYNLYPPLQDSNTTCCEL